MAQASGSSLGRLTRRDHAEAQVRAYLVSKADDLERLAALAVNCRRLEDGEGWWRIHEHEGGRCGSIRCAQVATELQAMCELFPRYVGLAIQALNSAPPLSPDFGVFVGIRRSHNRRAYLDLEWLEPVDSAAGWHTVPVFFAGDATIENVQAAVAEVWPAVEDALGHPRRGQKGSTHTAARAWSIVQPATFYSGCGQRDRLSAPPVADRWEARTRDWHEARSGPPIGTEESAAFAERSDLDSAEPIEAMSDGAAYAALTRAAELVA